MYFLKLRKLSKACDVCGESFHDKAYSTLNNEGEVCRKDLCVICFSAQKPPIWWHASIEEKKTKPILMTPYEQQLFDLFITALNEKNKSDHWIYFLAHYFTRRKLFVSQGDCEKEGKTFEILESKESQEVFVVPKATPSSDIAKEISEDLKHV